MPKMGQVARFGLVLLIAGCTTYISHGSSVLAIAMIVTGSALFQVFD